MRKILLAPVLAIGLVLAGGGCGGETFTKAEVDAKVAEAGRLAFTKAQHEAAQRISKALIAVGMAPEEADIVAVKEADQIAVAAKTVAEETTRRALEPFQVKEGEEKSGLGKVLSGILVPALNILLAYGQMKTRDS